MKRMIMITVVGVLLASLAATEASAHGRRGCYRGRRAAVCIAPPRPRVAYYHPHARRVYVCPPPVHRHGRYYSQHRHWR